MTNNQLSMLNNSIAVNNPYIMTMFEDNSVIEDALLHEKGNLKCLTANELRRFSFQELRQFAHKKAIYQFPTIELIQVLGEIIGNDSCLEIAAGTGSIGRHLGIKTTDSHLQNRPEMRLHYQAIECPTIKYPKDVEKLNAKEAIKKYKPKCVLGCWATHLYVKNRHEESGNMYGVDYDWVYSHLNKFILITNTKVHEDFPHPKGVKVTQVYESDHFISRAREGKTQIWVFSHK